MNIGIIGSGMIGANAGKLWLKAGHQVCFASRHPESLQHLVAELGKNASAGSVSDAIEFGEVLFFAIPFGAWPEIAKQHYDQLETKIVIDAGNPYPGRDGEIAATALNEGSGKFLSQMLPGISLAKAFNTIYYKVLESEHHRKERIGVCIAGTDERALDVTAKLVEDAGFDPVRVGDISKTKLFDPGTAPYNNPKTKAEIEKMLNLV